MSLSPAIPLRAPARRTVLRSAAAPPAFGPGLVARARLVQRLQQARDVPLVLLAAPAGYGKTTALLDWAQHDPRPFAWLALDRGDDDPDRLLASVARCTDAARDRGDEFVLVLDGVHALRSRGAGRALADLVAQPPAGSQVVLSCRGRPRLPLGRLRAHREVLELTTRDFVMTHREAAALLERAGVALGTAQIEALVQRTEGWPVGLYLAALSVREQADADAAVSRFGGDDRLVAEYVADALLADLAADEVTFLLRTSVLDRLCGPLCDAVLEQAGGGAATLKGLARANLPLVALDRTDRWYRHHRLLGEALRAELRRRDPQLEVQLHRRASRWHAGHGDVDAAIRHAVAAADVALAGELLWANALRHLAEGREATMQRWLAHLGERRNASHPGLALVAAQVHLARGERDLAEHWTEAAVRARDAAPPSASIDAGIEVARADISRDGLARMRDRAARAYALEPGESASRAVACRLEGTARHLLGDRDGAFALLREGSRRAVVTAPGVNALCLAQLALLALESGDRHEAAGLAARARAQVERSHLHDQPATSVVLAISALIRAQLGQLDAARADAIEAMRLRDALADAAAWQPAQVAVVLGRATLVLGDVAGARALLDDAARAAAAVPESPVLAAWIADARTELECFAASATAMPASLTAAELRILRLLPTHLSFREMGARLYVSPNTVKTQAQAVYRKLDASSRSEAVRRAHALGLLDDAADV